jgi:hypothetical protein
MKPVFYDVETFEPLPPSGVEVRELVRAPASEPSPALTTMTSAKSPLQPAVRRRLEPAGRFERLVVTRDRLVAIGPERLRVLDRDLRGSLDLPAPIGLRVDAGRDLVYMADVLGSVVGRRTRDLSIAFRILPTFPRGYERWVLYADASSLLLASVELQQMSHQITHVPEITMFEWWKLGDLANVDPSSFELQGAEIDAVTYSRTRPLLFAAPPETGDPLVLAQPGHLLWLDRRLAPVADVALPADVSTRALAVDAQGRALLAVAGPRGDRFWIVERTGQQRCDVALLPQPLGMAPAILPAAGGATYLIAGSTVIRVDDGGERWRAQVPTGPLSATLDREGDLLASSGSRLLRIDAEGNVFVLYDAPSPLVSAPVRHEGQILVSTEQEVLALAPAP